MKTAFKCLFSVCVLASLTTALASAQTYNTPI